MAKAKAQRFITVEHSKRTGAWRVVEVTRKKLLVGVSEATAEALREHLTAGGTLRTFSEDVKAA